MTEVQQHVRKKNICLMSK